MLEWLKDNHKVQESSNQTEAHSTLNNSAGRVPETKAKDALQGSGKFNPGQAFFNV